MKTYIKSINIAAVMLSLMIMVTIAGCKKFVTVDPPVNALTGNMVFADDATATASVVSIYSRLMENQSNSMVSGNQSISVIAGTSSDEQQVYTVLATLVEFGRNNIAISNSYNAKLWGDAYANIYAANAVIEGLSASTKVSDNTKKQLMGEAYFVRAFMHFYLVNLYGAVPYVTTTNYQINQTVSRLAVTDVYNKIIEDLVQAKSLLADNYIFSGNERTRPTKMAAAALLARVYLYTGDWAKAETEASAAISTTALFNLPALAQAFLKGSREAIWQLQPVRPGTSSGEGVAFFFASVPTRTALTSSLANSFETGDMRKTTWMATKTAGTATNYQPNKYKERTISATAVPAEYLIVLRLAEQYLIRAEARANLNNISGSAADLNAVRTRAGLGGTSANDKATLLAAIEKERRVELFSEWGHRWFDLKRTSRADAVLAPVKGANWQTTDQVYPIPQTELDRNKNLVQNPGY